MKYFIVLFTLLTSVLIADEGSIFGMAMPHELKIFQTEKNISIEEIENYHSEFKATNKEEGNNITVTVEEYWFEAFFHLPTEDNITKTNHLWVMLELDENLTTGRYWVDYTLFEFFEHSFAEHQRFDRFSLFGRTFFSFHYQKDKDKKNYFLKLTRQQLGDMTFVYMYTPQHFTKLLDSYSLKMILSFFLLGLIFMTALYNGALYLYNREKAFLHYMLMQGFMVIILIYNTRIINNIIILHMENMVIAVFLYFFIALCGVFFLTQFLRSFLETKKHLPLHDKILYYIIVAIVVDMVLFPIPIMLMFSFYTPFMLYFIYVAWKRYKQGYKPALFLIFGWLALTAGIVSRDTSFTFFLDPMLLGSIVEALIFSIALSYKVKTEQVEKEEQKPEFKSKVQLIHLKNHS